MNAGDVRLAEPHARAALEAAEELGDPEFLADARVTNDAVRFLLAGETPADLALRARRFAVEGEQLDAHPGFLARATVLASLLKWSDDLSGARQVLEDLRRRLEDREEDGPLVPVLFHLGELECWAGDVAAAAAIANELEPIATRLGPNTTSQALYLSGLVAALRGDVHDANAAATSGLELARGRDARLVIRNLKLLGFLGLSRGDFDSARPWLEQAADLATANGFLDPGIFRLAADAIEARVELGDLERSQRQRWSSRHSARGSSARGHS
jgi:hypothetical protein